MDSASESESEETEQKESALERTAIDATSLRALSVDLVALPPPTAPVLRAAEPEEDDTPRPRRRIPILAWVFFVLVIGGALTVIGLAARSVRADLAARHDEKTPVAASPASPASPVATATATNVEPPAGSAHSAVLAVAPAKPPAMIAPTAPPASLAAKRAHDDPFATRTTIRLAKKAHAFKVDGKPVTGTSVEVSCGPHVVQLDKEKPRHVEAVCGEVLVVDAKTPSKSSKAH